MKTYQQFLEVTSADIRAMGGNEKQMKILRDRQKARGGTGMGQKGSTGSHMHQKQDKKGGALATRPSSAISKAADKGSAIVRQKQGGIGREAIGKQKGINVDPKKPRKGYMSSPDMNTKKRNIPDAGLKKKSFDAAKHLAGKALGALASNKPPSKIEKATPLSLTPGGVNSKYSK